MLSNKYNNINTITGEISEDRFGINLSCNNLAGLKIGSVKDFIIFINLFCFSLKTNDKTTSINIAYSTIKNKIFKKIFKIIVHSLLSITI
ncbi:Uncharacterised protein [Clostridium putrefaciens]|uniref:Uncharacterized protein n=1 Tax=Clostridium putrefaciens TaxID=99675 RepID=A0A381J894_9CLOT|nr:Uncharacterised protein [Clostridium putrefaciens]